MWKIGVEVLTFSGYRIFSQTSARFILWPISSGSIPKMMFAVVHLAKRKPIKGNSVRVYKSDFKEISINRKR